MCRLRPFVRRGRVRSILSANPLFIVKSKSFGSPPRAGEGMKKTIDTI